MSAAEQDLHPSPRNPLVAAPDQAAGSAAPAPVGGLPLEPALAPDVLSPLQAALELLPPAPPLSELAAVNPLAGLDHLRFEDAAVVAAHVFGADAYLPLGAYRDAWASGRISADDLRQAFAHRAAAAPGGAPRPHDPVVTDPRVEVTDVLVADLDIAPEAPAPARQPMTPAEWWDAATGDAVRAEVDRRVDQWVGLALGLTGARLRGPVERHGLFAAWCDAAARDRSLPAAARHRVAALHGAPEAAIVEALVRLGVPDSDVHDVVVGEVTARPGWAARLAWEAAHGRYRRPPLEALAELVAVRLGLTMALLPTGAAAPGAPEPAATAAGAVVGPPPEARAWAVAVHLGVEPRPEVLEAIGAVLSHLGPERRALWHAALEAGPRRALVDALLPLGTRPRRAAAVARPRPAAQVVCCIDVRSEALRRHLERLGDYETLGFAGFFGLPMAWRRLDRDHAEASCPLVVEPSVEVSERAADPHDAAALRRRRHGVAGLASATTGAAKGAVSPYLWAEAFGWVAGPAAAARTLAPTAAARLAGRGGRGGDRRSGAVEVDLDAIPVRARAELAEGALRTMGLTSGFAPAVVLCGHGSTTTANPYEAALRCGACGGRDGTDNARTMAAVLQDPEVRRALAERGIAIPDDTVFVAAGHDTTTDRVALVGPPPAGLPRRSVLERLAADLAAAGDAVAAERAGDLPGARPGSARRARRRAWDWAEPTPEWGLAGNLAFVIGDRSLTRGTALGRRAFLHSYDRDADHDGALLTGILAGPALVTQWINAAYHFSVTAPDVFGAGSKALHNPVGVAGVLSGPDGDLRLGLPRQSVAAEALVHEPLRLLLVVDAPLERVERALDGAERTRDLVVNEWVALVARDELGRWWRRAGDGWQPTSPTPPTLPTLPTPTTPPSPTTAPPEPRGATHVPH